MSTSSSNVADYEGEDFQLWTCYMSSRLSTAIRSCNMNPIHPEFLSYLQHEAGLAVAVVLACTTCHGDLWVPPNLSYLFATIPDLQVLTPEIVASLADHTYDQDDVLLDYKELWWCHLCEIGPVPRHLESLVDCLNAFQEDRCQMVGDKKPIQPLPPVDLQDARKLLCHMQIAGRMAANTRVVALEMLRDDLSEAGCKVPLKAPTDIISETQQQMAGPLKKPTLWERAQKFAENFGGLAGDGTRG
ncbi:hypothetical protein H1R20_g9838, partial [Candolleomyces eurysporus]